MSERNDYSWFVEEFTSIEQQGCDVRGPIDFGICRVRASWWRRAWWWLRRG